MGRGDGEKGREGEEGEGESQPSVKHRVEHVEGGMRRRVGMGGVGAVGGAEGN